MSSSITFVYDKKMMTDLTRQQLTEYAKLKGFGLYFGHNTELNQEIVDNSDESQYYFILSDAQIHDTVDEILSWNWQWTKDRLIDHHLYLDGLKNILMQNQPFNFCVYVSFESYTSLLEYKTVTNLNSISRYFADYILLHYLMPDSTKFVYSNEV